ATSAAANKAAGASKAATVASVAVSPAPQPPVVLPATPTSAGRISNTVNHAVGDEYVYASMDPYSKVVSRRQTWAVSRVTEDHVEYNNGKIVTDLLGNLIRRDAERWTPNHYHCA